MVRTRKLIQEIQKIRTELAQIKAGKKLKISDDFPDGMY